MNKILKKIKYSALSLGLLGLSSMLGACASITAMQGAKTLKAGEQKTVVGVGYSDLRLKTEDNAQSSGTPSLDVMGRYGITDKDEVGVRVANFGTFLVGDYKRALIESATLNLSAGAGIGGTKWSVGVGESESATTIIDFYAPLYVDFPVSDMATIIVSPKYIFRVAKTTGADSQSSSQLALSGGLKYGQTQGVIVEAAYTKALVTGGGGFYQLMGSFFF